MNPKTFLFFGPSGCGKGTQAELLIELLKKTDSENEVVYIEIGKQLREFSKETSLSAKHTGEIMAAGGLLPSFMPIWVWTTALIKRVITGKEHLIFDGICRQPHEAPILNDAFKFYDRLPPVIFVVNVSKKWATDRLLGRGRSDDTHEDIAERLNWYDANVVPTIGFFRKNPYYKVIDINGEQTIPQVHEEILKKLKEEKVL